MDCYHLVIDVIDRQLGLDQRTAALRQEMVDGCVRVRAYLHAHGDDPPEVPGWSLPES